MGLKQRLERLERALPVRAGESPQEDSPDLDALLETSAEARALHDALCRRCEALGVVADRRAFLKAILTDAEANEAASALATMVADRIQSRFEDEDGPVLARC